ncbi:MAG: hypothetical protein RIG62_27040 [Cyclobacteriaceae bacterium]
MRKSNFLGEKPVRYLHSGLMGVGFSEEYSFRQASYIEDGHLNSAHVGKS